jgi:uncharacterized membrane protein
MKNISAYVIGVGFILAGANHFINPEFYLRMMPPMLPAHELMNYASGAAEIILGVLLFIPQTKVIAAWGLIILLIAVYPANIYMAMEAGKSIDISPVVAYIRLPFQFLFIWLVYRETK